MHKIKASFQTGHLGNPPVPLLSAVCLHDPPEPLPHRLRLQRHLLRGEPLPLPHQRGEPLPLAHQRRQPQPQPNDRAPARPLPHGRLHGRQRGPGRAQVHRSVLLKWTSIPRGHEQFSRVHSVCAALPLTDTHTHTHCYSHTHLSEEGHKSLSKRTKDTHLQRSQCSWDAPIREHEVLSRRSGVNCKPVLSFWGTPSHLDSHRSWARLSGECVVRGNAASGNTEAGNARESCGHQLVHVSLITSHTYKQQKKRRKFFKFPFLRFLIMFLSIFTNIDTAFLHIYRKDCKWLFSVHYNCLIIYSVVFHVWRVVVGT